MGVCKQVAFLILNYITFRLVPLLKVFDAPIQVPNVLDLTVNFEFLSSQICLLFVSEMFANFTPCNVQVVYVVLAWIYVSTAFVVAFFDPKNLNTRFTNLGLFCFNSCRPRLYSLTFWYSLSCLPKLLPTSYDVAQVLQSYHENPYAKTCIHVHYRLFDLEVSLVRITCGSYWRNLVERHSQSDNSRVSLQI